jgi:hypothetical protein
MENSWQFFFQVQDLFGAGLKKKLGKVDIDVVVAGFITVTISFLS